MTVGVGPGWRFPLGHWHAGGTRANHWARTSHWHRPLFDKPRRGRAWRLPWHVSEVTDTSVIQGRGGWLCDYLWIICNFFMNDLDYLLIIWWKVLHIFTGLFEIIWTYGCLHYLRLFKIIASCLLIICIWDDLKLWLLEIGWNSDFLRLFVHYLWIICFGVEIRKFRIIDIIWKKDYCGLFGLRLFEWTWIILDYFISVHTFVSAAVQSPIPSRPQARLAPHIASVPVGLAGKGSENCAMWPGSLPEQTSASLSVIFWLKGWQSMSVCKLSKVLL